MGCVCLSPSATFNMRAWAHSTMQDVEGKKVWVGLSGGVDSSVAAARLLGAGADLHGVYLKCWEDALPDGRCPWEQDQKDAQKVAEQLSIPFRSINLVPQYKERVFRYMLNEYESGRTPNPDVVCNREIKFGLFLEEALANGADFIATGHYVRKQLEFPISNFPISKNPMQLLMGIDQNKDQSYFLWQLTSQMLKHALFPIGDMEKTAVREEAARRGFETADKPDSTGICFVGEVPMQEFLEHYLEQNPGPVLTLDGTVVGEHKGLHYYTIGQRKGIGVYGGGPPYFVTEKNKEKNALIVVPPAQEAILYGSELIADELNWISGEAPKLPKSVMARVRYRQQLQEARVEELDEGRIRVTFTQPQRAITSGQSVVLYDRDVMLGGGVIV